MSRTEQTRLEPKFQKEPNQNWYATEICGTRTERTHFGSTWTEPIPQQWEFFFFSHL